MNAASAPLAAAVFALTLAGCASAPDTIEHRDEVGLWSCPASRPGRCFLLEPSPPRIDWGEMEGGQAV